MKLSSVFSYADIVDMRNEGLNDDEIINKAKEKIAYQKSPEYGAKLKAGEIENAKRKELAKNFANYAITGQDQANLMSGRNTADEIASKYRKNIQNYEEKQIYKKQAEANANSKQKKIASAIDTMGGGLGEAAVGIAKGATFIPHTIAKALANNTDSQLAKNFYEKSKQARSNLDKAQELYNARTGQEGKALYKTGEIATEILTDPLTYWMPFMKAPTFAARGAGYALTGAAEGALHEYGSNEKASTEDIAKMAGLGAALGLGGGALIEGAIKGGGALYSKFKNRGAGANTEPNSAPNTQNSSTAPNTPNSNADDLATNGIWMEYSANTPQSLRKPNHTSNALRANLEDQQLTLKEQIEKTQESLKNAINKKRLDEAKTLKEKLEKAQKELGEIEKQIGFLDKERDLYPNEMRGSTFNTAEQPINSGDIKGSGFILQGDRKALPSPKLKTADIIDLVPDENGVYKVAYNGSSKELAKIATEIAKGEIQSLGAKRLVYIADNIAAAAAKDAEQKISANIAKIDDDSVELYANNTALLGDIAKKYPMLNKDEQIELANKQILANASPELLEYSKFLNGGTLPNDARLLGKNAGRMILKSLNAGAEPAEIVDMLIKAGISGRNSTAAKALLQTRDINAYNAQMRKAEAELIAELSQNVRVAAKNESIGAILDSAKAKALENDELLKKGVGNQGLDDVINTFKSSKSGKEFEVAENGFGRELLSYDGQVANEEMKRAFLAWEAQEKKADITLHDGRKVVFLEPDEAVQLSYGNSYLYGEKDLEALFARRRAESLEQKLKRLQSHPAYENLLKMRENTKASELKGDTVDGSKPIVFYEPQSERYLRTQGGGGLPNAERSITITKADVAKLRADKADVALATKLENNLEALTGDPAASGLIDDLLTRDYHLASAAKKSELVAPKNADEVAKSAENTQRNSKILTNQDIKEQISKWDLSAPKQTLITNKIDGEELEKLNEHFKFKGNYPLTRQIDSEHIKHALSHHGDEKIEALRGQKAITLDDIANYENYAKTADIKEYIDKKVISKKQINGHFVVVEEALTGKNRLNFVSMWYVKGKIKDVAPVSTPKNDLDRTLSNRYDSANSSKDEIKSQGVGGKLEPLKTDESKNFKVFDGLVGFFEDNLSKRKNAYADFADGGSASGQRESRYEKSQKIELLDKYLAEYPKAKEISANIAKKLAFANRENKKLNKQQISDLFGYYKNNKENKELLDKNIEYALAKELLDPVLNESEKAFNDIAKKYGLPAKFRGRVMDDIRYRHKLATRATDQTKDQFQIQIFKDFARHLESLEKERSFSVSEAELRAASINDIEFLLKATPHLKQVKSGEDYISELNGLKQQAVMNKINELMAKGADESEFEKLSNHEYISELARAEFAKEHGFEYKAQKVNDKSQEQKRTGLKRGFSTQALNELMLGLGSGGANAMAEDDPNKKAEAFIKGFLAGFGGAKAASMLVKNAPKLAPQLARASEKMASDFPRLLNDRPDILGGVLGRMNNAKDKFSFIFGGEKALGANKAKLEKAKDMAKNGAKDDEIWAKTGWYKDIDGKWKFEINAEGGKLKELNAPELDEATKIIKRDYFDKQMNLKELEDFIQFKNGYIDFDAIKKFYDLPKDMSKGELTQKFPYFKMSVNDYMEHGFYKDIDLLHDEIMPARKILNQEYSKTPLNEVLDDPELFASYPQLKDVKVSVDELKSTEQAHFNPNKNEIVLNSHLDAEDMKSSLYHELQHKVQEIEGFGAGGNTQKLSYQEYKNLAGESEARNVQKRLNRTYSKDDAIDGEFNRLLIKDMDNPKWQELKQKRRELILAGKLDEADKIKKQLDQRQEFLKREAVKNVERFSSYSPHPFNTLDINPNDRIVKYDSGMSASMELEKDLLTSQGRVNTNALLKNASKMPKALSRDEFEAQFNANISGDSYVKTPIGDIKVNVEKAWEHFKKNTYNQDRSDLSGAFIHTLQDPLFIVKQNWKPTASPHTMGQSIAKSQNAKRLMDDRQQEIITQSTIFFKPFSDENGGKYLASFAIDKNGELIQKTFYDIDSLEKIKKMIRTPENNVLYYKNARNQTMGYKDAEAGMRESFSPELKASYDMRDKLLKSTNEVRASLNEKGKAELEKLAGSKDSKLSRDAQIMKTLENAKSNPTRYERLKKLYLDENGKVKDSIGLC